MTEDSTHKFQDLAPITYKQLFDRMFTNFASFLRELESTLGSDKLHDILRTWSERRGVEMAGDRKITSFKEFKDFWKESSAGEYFSHVTSVEFPHETDTEFHCTYSECLYAKTFRDLDAAELGYIMVCHPDFNFTESLSPNLSLERTRTLMEGHDCCDHKFVWRE
ncbi:MAG: L-2-amino-thiazoline-4-carboxylic acid hydrolase [Candidatus Thorarchaeota archaeon]|jgi:hypothetical protein